MTSEVRQLQQMMETCVRPAKIFAITSGKGGVGKTNIATNLSICLASSGKKVLLVDADLSLANVDILMNINSKYNISHFFNGRKSIEEIIQTGPGGMEIICGASGFEELSDMNEFQRHRILSELSRLQNENEIIVIDTAGSISKSVVGFCLFSDHVLVVTTPEATSMTDAYAMIKVLVGNNYSGQISLIVNMAASLAEGKKTYQQISKVVLRFLNTQVYNAGILLKDCRLSSAVRERKPVVLAYPKAAISSSLAVLASKLSKNSARPSENAGFFKKVMDWFF